MNYDKYTFNNEDKIMEYFRNDDMPPLAFPEDESVWNIYQSIYNEKTWQQWKSSFGKSDLPPDYFNEDLKLMMEVMRFDDHATKKGKENATLARKRKMLKELEKSGMLNLMPNLENIILNPDTKLDTHYDHNFQRYRDNFCRVVSKHGQKVNQYKENHIGYKLIFFVLDETSGMYFENNFDSKPSHGMIMAGHPHFYWADEIIIKAIKESNADYLIIFKPFNNFNTATGMNSSLPKIIIYDIKNMKIKTKKYDSCKMISSEI